MKPLHALGAGVVVSGLLLAAVPAANASTGLVIGHCTRGGTVTLQLQNSDPGLIEAGLEVDHVKAGGIWTVTLTRNRVTYYRGTQRADRTTSFSVDRVLRAARTNLIAGTATNKASHDICTVHGVI